MEEKMICDIALQEGFDNAIFMDVEDFSFEPELRKYCEDNVCGNYNNNYACPPYCGTPAEMEKRARRYKRALILQTIHQVTAIKDIEQTKNVQKIHNQKTLELIGKIRGNHEIGISIMAGPCTLCEQCSKRENKPCHLPETPASCLSAYCINAQKMAEHCKIPYRCDNNQIAFFSILLKNMR